jgi:hypothetical protein
MIRAIENQTLLDIAIQENGSVLSAFDYALGNGISITDTLTAGQGLNPIPYKKYETSSFYELFEKHAIKRDNVINAIENQSLLDVAIQEDGCVLAVFDWAFDNGLSITDTLTPGQKIKMPKTEVFRYDELASFFKSNNTMIATLSNAINTEFEYYLPGEFPYSF